MQKCPKCYNTEQQNEAGQTSSGTQRYRYMFCGSKCTPQKKLHHYDVKVRKQGIRLYVDGMNLRRTTRHLGIHPTALSAWIKEYVITLPQASQSKSVNTAEMDELFTFITIGERQW